MRKITGLVFITLLLAAGCGPMNTKPADTAAAQKNQCSGSTDESAPKLLSSSKKSFLIIAQLKANADSDVNAPQVQAQVGSNQYVVKLVHLQDPRKTSEITLASATFLNKKKAGSKPYAATVEKQTDGTYLVTFDFISKKPGPTFDVTFNLVDGSVTDSVSLELTLQDPNAKTNPTPEPSPSAGE